MPWLLNVLYLVVLVLLSPWLVWRAIRTGRYRKDLLPKLTGRVPTPPQGTEPVVWFHAVSVGEVHLLSTVVAAFQTRHPTARIVVSSTTDTGLAEARARFAHHTVIPFPFDFSWAVDTVIQRLNPTLLVLAEGELWPNLLRLAHRCGVRVAIINGRLSPRSFGRYRRVAGLARYFMFQFIDRFAVQDKQYAQRYRALGIPAHKVIVTGSVKYDVATAARNTPKAESLKAWLGNSEGPILVAGSTHAPEEEYVLTAFQTLRIRVPQLRLILVPRHPDRFEAVAKLIQTQDLTFARRSDPTALGTAAVILLDTIGELGAAWSLATVGYVGGTLDGQRGGQSMIEPAAYGVPTVFGPHVWNFRDAANRLVDANGAVMIRTPEALAPLLLELLIDCNHRNTMSLAAQELVASQQGATQRTLAALGDLMGENANADATRTAA